MLTSLCLAADENGALEQMTVFRSGEGYASYRIPSAIVTPSNTLLVFCEGRSKPSDTGDIDLIVKRSTDQGKRFSEQQIVWSDDANTCGNPCPVVDETSGTIWLLMTHNLGTDSEKKITEGTARGTRTVWVTSSTDDGITWTKPRQITSSVKKPDWAWYATGPGVGIQLKRGKHAGRLVIPCDHVVLGGGLNKGNSHVIYSDDHGKTWTIGGEPDDKCFNESQCVELSNGDVMVNMRNYRGGGGESPRQRGVAISNDGGETFGAYYHDETLIEPICQASILRYSWPEDPTGSIILFSNPASRADRVNLTARLSSDEGKTWTASRQIHDGGSAYSCLVKLPDGSIGLLYEAWEKERYARIDFARFSLDWLRHGEEE